jgi:hypothetical protein
LKTSVSMDYAASTGERWISKRGKAVSEPVRDHASG